MQQEPMIGSVDMNALLGILRRILRRDLSITELGKLLTLIGSFKDDTEDDKT